MTLWMFLICQHDLGILEKLKFHSYYELVKELIYLANYSLFSNIHGYQYLNEEKIWQKGPY